MNKKQHLYGAFISVIAFVAVSAYYGGINAVVDAWWHIAMWLFIVPLIALLPDIDTEFGKHRALFHNIFVFIIFTIILFMVKGNMFILPMWIGYLSHVFLDMTTKRGIMIFYPITSKPIGGLGVEAKSIGGTFATIGVSILFGAVFAVIINFIAGLL